MFLAMFGWSDSRFRARLLKKSNQKTSAGSDVSTIDRIFDGGDAGGLGCLG
ncbi:MAG: hypothetical protein KBT62_09400 [Sulfitobacter litoralis]|jgi:hypothetical protein|uniref:hypothetical protein n=1 Tax=Sulfitobacter TaxID=60136 RepID=UPI001B4883AB|nr:MULTISPECIES: hypothetical protein [Sulfitobacter]MBQ0766551.1 hypothetical protein [Sulfitobacter litoralis]|tara:strand:+ start:914 stop:1066 length:153 start_codon:yes stop_codon:yes gene_type:complete